jgi:hypothetical protein
MGAILDPYGREVPPRGPRFSWRNASTRAKAVAAFATGIVAAIALLLGNVSTIHDWLFPKDAKLRVTIFESDSDTLNLFPSTDTSKEQTEDIPLQLKIANIGGRGAKNVKVYLSYNLSIVLTAQYAKEEKRTWNAPNEAMKQLALSLPDVAISPPPPPKQQQALSKHP